MTSPNVLILGLNFQQQAARLNDIHHNVYNTMYENIMYTNREGKYIKNMHFCLKSDIPDSKGQICQFFNGTHESSDKGQQNCCGSIFE
jgi:hypothetical protein